jgi:2-polyprenyl-3-methyl-5-hydroxy-6-metoxy-1,4-benzoquinol methylase
MDINYWSTSMATSINILHRSQHKNNDVVAVFNTRVEPEGIIFYAAINRSIRPS